MTGRAVGRSLRRDDRGLTLVELLVTTVLAAILLPLVTVVLVDTQSRVVDTQATAQSVADARLVVQRMQRQVNNATEPLLVSSDGLTVGFWTEQPVSGLPAGSRCVQYAFVSVPAGGETRRELRMRTWTLTGTRPDWAAAQVVVPRASTLSRFARVQVEAVEDAAASISLHVLNSAEHPASVSTVLTARNRPTTALPTPHPCAPTS